MQSGKWKEAWGRLSAGDHFFLPILAANVLVYGLWRIPRLQPMLLKNFSANPYGRKSLLDLKSAHLGLNIINIIVILYIS